MALVRAMGLLDAAGIGVGLIQRWNRARRALRTAVAAAGAFFLWRAVA